MLTKCLNEIKLIKPVLNQFILQEFELLAMYRTYSIWSSIFLNEFDNYILLNKNIKIYLNHTERENCNLF